jgi:hypothetical protein
MMRRSASCDGLGAGIEMLPAKVGAAVWAVSRLLALTLGAAVLCAQPAVRATHVG